MISANIPKYVPVTTPGDVSSAIYGESNNLGRGLGVLLRKVFWDDDKVTHKRRSDFKAAALPKAVPFQEIYAKLFPQSTIRLVYAELDPGVDDGAALLQLLAASLSKILQKKVEILGVVPCVGNAVLSQTELNTRQFLELTKRHDIPVYPGALSPLAIENNSEAILEMEIGINKTEFYGGDGEEDVGGWPKVTIPLHKTRGYIFSANTIAKASPETAVTLLSTSALTELSKTLDELVALEKKNNLPPGTYAKNINVISIMGGCIDPEHTECNAPFNETKKISEANLFFDSDAARKVFEYCQLYNVPILLAPLDLTQQPGLAWTEVQDGILIEINNSVSSQWARVTGVVPHIDAKHFPNGTYPMHDLFAAAPLLKPRFFYVIQTAIKIGSVGQTLIDPHAKNKNVYILTMPEDMQPHFYKEILKEFANFDCPVDKKCPNYLPLYIGLAVFATVITFIAVWVFRSNDYCRSSPERSLLIS